MSKCLYLMLIALTVLSACAAAAGWQPAEGRIMTPWADKVDPQNVLPDYPRPLMVRDAWQNLNGLWEYTIVHRDAVEIEYWDGSILVPFAAESALSGVAKRVGAEKALWYRRQFTVPADWKDRRVLLHFGAVDWQSTVWIDGKEVGSHKGGYDPFTLDITEAVKPGAAQELKVRVWDPTDQDNSPIPRGKQVSRPEGIWYTPVTGIWQTVWLEPVPQASVQNLKITPDLDRKQVTVEVAVRGDAKNLSLTATAAAPNISASSATTDGTLVLRIDNPKLWTPDDPFLYDLTVQLKNGDQVVDEVTSYFGMRKIEIKKDENGVNRLFLNNQPVFQFGLLDQGWWPDGLYTAPTDEALRYDVDLTKQWGFNMLRKHVKVEPQRLYTWCDKMGVLVWQDMPSCMFNRNAYSAEELKQIDAQWESEWKAIIEALYNHPSIVMWVPFNEGWGQYDTERITKWTKDFDPSRIVNNASGWTDKGVGDVHDIHNYPNPAMPDLEDDRAAVLGEFGGLGLPLRGHLWEAGGNWGYRTYQQQEEFERRYTDLIHELYALVPKGLTAAVYTQTTDVEIEVNGLMTYDRRVIKLDPERFAPVNRGYLPPLFTNDTFRFIDSIEVALASNHDAKIYYTLDGSEPTESSKLYDAPITLDQTATVRARCVWSDGTTSPVASREFEKVRPVKAVEADPRERGLLYAAYEGRWQNLPDFSTLTPVKSGAARNITLDLADRRENFALRFTGFLRVPETGVWRFAVRSDDGSKLFLHGTPVIDNDGVHGAVEVAGDMALEAGWHPIEIQYFQGGGGADLDVFWQGPGQDRAPLRGEILAH